MIHPTYSTILQLINKHFPNKKKLNVLDYGCGSGYFLETIGKERIGTYFGYDINENSIESAKRKYQGKNIHFFHVHSRARPNMDKAQRIDLIIFIGVLQYLSASEVKTFLAESKKRLKRGGILVLSCSTDHFLYRLINILQFFSPHELVDRRQTLRKIKRAGFRSFQYFERGIFISPIFSQTVGIVDLVDRFFFSTRGTIGPLGNWARSITNILLTLEYRLPVDFGYTLFIIAKV